MSQRITKGSYHIGLTVSSLDARASFFTKLLGWDEITRDEEYPAIFVSDGTVMVRLWKAKSAPSRPFSKDQHIGLHHVAFVVESERDLDQLYETISESGVRVEFSPELLSEGPAKHMMRYEPSGIRNDPFVEQNAVNTEILEITQAKADERLDFLLG